jgi:hypothetical protein
MMGRSNGIFAAIFAACLSLNSSLASAGANPLAARADQHVIADPRSGLALFGYDPVAYHADNAALLGIAQHELALDGRIWRFRSAANMAAFAADPAAYIPNFGGYDGASVSDGILAKGDPETFVIAGGQLVLFRDAGNRDRFAADQMVRNKARGLWPSVVHQLAVH